MLNKKYINFEDKGKAEKKTRVVESLEKVVDKLEIKDSMTISFHHHFRNGDILGGKIMEILDKKGLKNLTIFPSSLTSAHDDFGRYIKSGLIGRICTSGLRGKLGEDISSGMLDEPVVIRSHGGRARAIESGEEKIDVAFVAAPHSDVHGNANGFEGVSPCGSLGYALVDMKHADKVVVVTDILTDEIALPFSMPAYYVDYVVEIDKIGIKEKIMSGATRAVSNPKELLIAKKTAEIIDALGIIKENFSFQTGSGGSSLAVTRYMREKMIEKKVTADFALGGITGQIVKLHEEGLVRKLLDVQSFDLYAVTSLKNNKRHFEIDASFYANPNNLGCAVNRLDVVVLSALEIDSKFNVNVITGSDGVFRGASGGHSDTAAGAEVCIVVAPLVRGRIATVKEKVLNIVTPGSTIDILVTDHGIAVNPIRKDIKEQLKEAGIKTVDIMDLKEMAEKITKKPEEIRYTDKIVGLIEYRDGSIIDEVRQVE
jgi:citrate lyase subunit alpha/citrate CoA-transferase